MRPCIDDAVAFVVMGKKRIFRAFAKRELKNFHSGKLKLIAEGGDIRRNQAQILGNDWQLPQFPLHSTEQFVLRAVDPASFDCGFLCSRNFPVSVRVESRPGQ